MRFTHSHHPYFSLGVLAGILLAWPSPEVRSQILPETTGEAVLETADGMIVAGVIQGASGSQTVLATPFGTLHVPVDQIRRINGDQFTPDRGIIREHGVTLSPDGGAMLDYLQPAAGRPESESVQILIPGKVLEIKDLQDDPLPFLAQEIGGFSRCTVQWPRYRLPAVRIRALQPEAATKMNGRTQYTYRYSPRTDQTFRLKLTLPPGANDIQTSPDALRLTENQILWEQSAQRQQKMVFQVSYRMD